MHLFKLQSSFETALEALAMSAGRCVVISDARAADHPVVFVNRAFTDLTGYSEDQVIGRNCRFLQGPGTDPKTISRIRQALEAGEPYQCELLNYRKNGEAFWNDITIDPLFTEEGVVSHFLSFQHDATSKNQALRQLADAEQQLSNLFEHLPGYVFRRVLHPDFRITYPFLSRSIFRLLGLPEDTDWSADQLIANMHVNDRDAFRESIIQSGIGLSPLRSEFRLAPSFGRERWFRSDSSPRAMTDGTVIWEGLAVDITAEKTAEAKLTHLANHDQLTGLPNRSLFRTCLKETIASAKEGDGVTLFLIDLHNFQELNDDYGQDAGDLALQGVATTLLSYAEAHSGRAARVGGDEFAVVLPSLPPDVSVAAMAEAIHVALSGFSTGQDAIRATASRVGAVRVETFDDCSLRSAEDWAVEMMKRADLALQEAKRPGRRSWQTYSAAQDDRSHHRVALRRSLQSALSDKQFELHYQPQFDLSSGEIVGAEALLRWRHPQFGLQRPDLFIPYAEACGLIVHLGAWVVKEAMSQHREWTQNGLNPPGIAINVSGRQLQSSDFLDVVARAMRETGSKAENFEFELTEGTLIEASVDVQQQLGELRRLGFAVAIDDFGTGHSSFRYLREFAIDKIKIDQLFVKHLVVDSSDASIIRSMISLARSLKLSVVAEGIETSMQREFLVQEGCKVGQGYLLSRPLTSEAFTRLLQLRPRSSV